MRCIEVLRKNVCSIRVLQKIMNIASHVAKYSQCGQATYSFYVTRKCSVHVSVLQPLTGETLQYPTANYENGAHVDISASGFRGGKHQKEFF